MCCLGSNIKCRWRSLLAFLKENSRFLHGMDPDSKLLDQPLNNTQTNKRKQTPLNNIHQSL
jgi:hypothetical protein